MTCISYLRHQIQTLLGYSEEREALRERPIVEFEVRVRMSACVLLLSFSL